MVCNKTIFYEYVEIYNKHKKLYGEKTVLLMEVGMFYEMYSLNDGITGPPLFDLSNLLNILCTKKNKNIKEVSEKNPYMAGVPIKSIDKYIELLINNNYTVIIVDQFDNDMGKNSKKDRKVTEIISPSTYITDIASYKSNYLMSIYFYKFKDRKTKQSILSFSLSTIELSIGRVYLYENNTNLYKDEKILFDNIYRIILKYTPSEIIIFGDDIDFNLIKNKLNFDINNNCIHNKIDSYSKDILDITYQNTLLKKVYKNTGILNPIEYINLEKNQELLISFINLIEFSYSHNDKIIENIHKPILIENNEHLLLGYNLINKLDIVSDNDSKYSSLLNILNNSVTHIGKRYFKETLLNPVCDIVKINDKYENIEIMLLTYNDKEKIYDILRNNLKNICDLERYFRKIYLLKLQPSDFYNIYNSLKHFLEIIKFINEFNKIDSRFNKFNSLNNSRELLDLLHFLENNLNLQNIQNYNLDNINGHIFKKGVYNEIDDLQKNLDDNIDYFHETANTYNSLNPNYKSWFKVETNDQLGYFLQTTQNRFNIFKRENPEYKEISFKKISSSSNTVRLFLDESTDKNNQIINLISIIKTKCVSKYMDFCTNLYNKYETYFIKIIELIEILDYSCTNAYNSILYKYSKPNIVPHSKSFLELTEVRHPIIEIINEDIKYITNDIKLGIDNNDGILLYGMNSSGKSCLMKSIGLNIIMAQAGMYVPCKKMNYQPYNKIFSRIPGGDNIFKGQSTFIAEITEIRNILKSADNNTLIIGDELCSGTETVSAISIVSSGIIDLINKKSSFIFATHLHELSEMERINKIETLNIYHLSVKYNDHNNSLIFDRKIKNGSGDNLYGLEVCRSLDLDRDFINLANIIRQEILGTNILLKNKKSKYNSKLIIDKCNICKKENATETHHIRFQKDADENGFIEHFHKNKKFNLIGLCDNCHNNVHNGNLVINQAILSSNGIIY
jgi:DNA mismatch repair protein MutS